jgi:DNA polymerase-4
MVVTTEAGRRVLATCAEAARRGVQPGMTPRQVQALCPQAEVVPYDVTQYRQAADRLLTVLAEFTAHAEHESQHDLMRRANRSTRSADTRQVGVFYADVGRLDTREAQLLAGQIADAVHHYGGQLAGLGLAATRFTAFVAASVAEPGAVLHVEDTEAAVFLAPLPIALLWLDAETHRRLTLLGLNTLGQVAGLTRTAVYAQFGRRGVRFWERAQGIDARPVEVYRPRLSEQICWHFDSAILHRGALESVLRALGADLVARVQARGLMGRSVILTALLGDRSRRTVTRTLRYHISSTPAVVEALLDAFARIDPRQHGVDGFELTMADLVPFTGTQLALFDAPGSQREKLKGALEHLTARFGGESFRWIQSADLDSPLPEHQVALLPVLR